MPYGVRPATKAKVNRMLGQTLRRRKTANQKIKKAVENALKPHTTTAKGAMKPKILGNFIKPTRMTKVSYEGSWNGLCTSTPLQVSVPYVFRANSIWDPDFSNFTKNQRCNGWTAANTLYSDYRVHSVKVTVTFQNMGENPAYILLTANNDIGLQSAASYPSDLLTRPGSYGKICSRAGGKNDFVSISRKYKLYEIEGISQDEYRDSSSTASAMNNSPSDLAYVYATIAAMPEGFGPAGGAFGVFNIKMVFDVELLNPREGFTTAS